MAGKARVHQLAKELGVTSKEILAHLNEQGERVKSASSTLEAPVARRLRAVYADKQPSRSQRRRNEDERASGRPTHIRPSAATDRKVPSHKHLTNSQAARFRKEYRQAYAAKNRSDAINELCAKYESSYKVSRATLRELIAQDLQQAAEYTPLRRSSRDEAHRAQQQQGQPRQPAAGKALDGSAGAFTRPRTRRPSLPPVAADINLEAVSDLMLSKVASQRGREEIAADLQTFDPTGIGGYGYLAWRYAAVHRRLYSELSAETARDDLAVIAQVVDAEKRLLDEIVHACGSFLETSSLAKRAADSEFRDLTDSDDIGSSAADELRRVRAKDHFLRRAVVLTIASPDDERLWEMLGRIRSLTPTQLVETTPQLIAEIDRLNDRIAAVEALLSADDAALGRFFRQSHSELLALQRGRYDFLRKFHDIGSASSKVSRQTTSSLPFTVLPQGEQLRTFLAGMRSSGLYRGYQVDVKRLTVLEELEKHFGADVCDWYEGSESSRGVDNHYLVLAIKSVNGSGENAVAISPLTGQHATYVVRRECTDADWADIFASPKIEARVRGARRLLFATPDRRTDKYNAMRDKVITLLECDHRDFLKPLVFDENSDRYRMA